MASLGPGAALARVDADRLEVLLPLAADAHAEDHAPAGDVVEGGELLGDHARLAEGQKHDPGAERDPLRHSGEGGERDDDVQDRIAVRDVVARPDRVVAQLFRRLREVAVAARVGHPVDLLAAALDAERDGQTTVVRPAARHAFS